MDVQSVEPFSIYFAPLDQKGQRMDLADENGEVLDTFEIEIPEAAPIKSNGGVKRLAFPGSSPQPVETPPKQGRG